MCFCLSGCESSVDASCVEYWVAAQSQLREGKQIATQTSKSTGVGLVGGYTHTSVAVVINHFGVPIGFT
jgi:hypothetical protein